MEWNFGRIKGDNLMRRIVLITVVALWGVLLAQTPPPLCAAISDPGYHIAPYSSIVIKVSPACASNPAGTRYQFWRHVVSARPTMEMMTIFMSQDSFVFTGAQDGEVFEYYVRALYGSDTSDWSDPLTIVHDINPPAPVPFLDVAHCVTGVDTYVQITWQRTIDSASSIMGYGIYRSMRYFDLWRIDAADPFLAFIPNDGSEIYYYIDNDVIYGRTYYYTVVPYDSAGVPVFVRGHHPFTGNPIKMARLIGPGFCETPICAILMPPPHWITRPSFTVYTDHTMCHPRPGIMYQYRQIDETTGDTLTSVWTVAPSYNWLTRDCHTYTFGVRAKLDTITSDWSYQIPAVCDIGAPGCVDSLVATLSEAGIDVHFYVSDERALDCGSGVKCYKLFRFTDDELSSFFPVDTGDTRHLLYTFCPDSYKLNADYRYFDFASGLADDETYYYLVVVIDSLNQYSYCGRGMDSVIVDKITAAPMLIPLPTWSPGTGVTLSIVDTSHCDIVDIYIDIASSPDFTVDFTTIGPLDIHDPSLHNPDDHICEDWDTLKYYIGGLDEAQYYFRVWARDAIGNTSVYSNVVNTRFDNTPPAPTAVDSLHSYAKCTNELVIKLWFSPSTDAGVGVGQYHIYRSDSPGALGTEIGTINHNPFISVYTFVDESPNPGHNFRDNYYTILVSDNFGNTTTSGVQRGFSSETPPYPVRIDSVRTEYESGEMWLIVYWSDTTPSSYGTGGLGNMYRLQHSADSSWLCTGDPLLVKTEPLTFEHYMRLPRSIIIGSPVRYFHIATIDPWGNESGYSEPIAFFDSSWYTDSVVMHLYRGWNMISLPLLPRNTNVRDIFPSLIPGNCYTFNPVTGTYESVTNLRVGVGYWVLSRSDHYVMLRGYHIPEYIRTLEGAGYHMIGGISDTADFEVTPNGALARRLLSWWNPTIGRNGGYEDSDILVPGRGYFILLDSTATIHVPAGGARKSIIPESEVAVLNFEGQKLKLNTDGIDLPMPPPVFEVSLPHIVGENGEMLMWGSSNDGHWTIEVPESYNLTIEKLPKGHWQLSGPFGEQELAEGMSLSLKAGKYEVYYEYVPDKFVARAYPNPFNATAIIELEIPRRDNINVCILDINGRVIRNIYSGEVSQGVAKFVWDGKDEAGNELPSGVYFVRTLGTKFGSISRIVMVR